MRKTTPWMLVAAIILTSAAPLARAGEADDLKAKVEALATAEKEAALAVLTQNQEALVQVEIILHLTISMAGQQTRNQEQKFMIPGTTINAQGLTVISASGIDISRQVPANIKVDSQILGAKIIQNDGTEISARVALKDEDLDLVFVVPEKPGAAYAFVTLDRAAEAKPLDEILALGRMDMSANRTPLLQVGLLAGIIEKPRRYYVGPPVAPGNPAFTTEGKCLGLFLRRRGNGGVPTDVVILPAADVLDAAAQVKAETPADPPADAPAKVSAD